MPARSNSNPSISTASNFNRFTARPAKAHDAAPAETGADNSPNKTSPKTVAANDAAPAHTSFPTPDVYKRITDQIVAQIEAGAGQWFMPWHSSAARGLPVNAVSRKPYRGGNVLPLWVAAAQNGYTSREWATYRQWGEAGAQVRKGEKASLVVFWKFKDQDEVPDATQEEFNDRSSRLILVRGYSVFNADQVDGYTPRPDFTLSEPERIEHAENFFRHTKATIKTGGGRAFYTPKSDEIVLPPLARFPDAVSFYSVMAHEMTHWTGHETRLDRGLLTCFGSEAYAGEELVAELGAAFLCAALGLANEPRPDNAAYMATWLKALKNNPQAIFSAASKAQYAVDYLHGLQPLPAEPEQRAEIKHRIEPEGVQKLALSRSIPSPPRPPGRGPGF